MRLTAKTDGRLSMVAVVLLGATLALVAEAGPGAGAASAAARPAGARPAGAVALPPGVASRRTITLPTGDRIKVTTRRDGRVVVMPPLAPRPGSAPFQSFRVGPHVYVVPHSAAAKIGRSMAMSRFDVTAPGTPVVRPHFPMHTLTIKGIDVAGRPDNIDDVDVFNVDDVAKFHAAEGFAAGQVRLSVPNGHYSAKSLFVQDQPGGRTVRLVMLPEFTVLGDTTITIDARTATSRLSVTTPRPAVAKEAQIVIGRFDAQGDGFLELQFTDAKDTVYLAPTKSVTVGQMHYYTYWRLAAADGSYTYDLEFPADGAISAGQHHVVTTGQLATLTARYYSEVPRPGADERNAFLPWQNESILTAFPLSQPTQRTEYILANPNIAWTLGMAAYFVSPDLFVGERFTTDARVFTAGQRWTMEWNKQPLHPGVVETAGGSFVCPVCRIGDKLRLAVDPFADNDPAHGGVEDDNPPPNVTESASQVLYQNGKPVAVDQPTGLYAVTPSPASFRMVVDTVRKSPYFTLSTKAHTEWTFRSSHADGSGQLPAGWECDLAGLTDCAVTPLMMARYDLPQSMSDRHPAGATSFVLTVAHLQGGPELPVTSATVSVSYDDGATWQPTKVTDVGDSHFRVSYTTPAVKATNGFVALKLSAVDASGGTITQTISRAYALG